MIRPLTFGTAGHIDHGKTALVRALTGLETDRLVEERKRGISIELGFAPLELGERRLSLIDVPGHERLVRTMIAGAIGIDAYLLVVAADDGVMPQTTEHMAVLRALGVQRGVVALTKCDVAEESARARAVSMARELAPGTPVIEVSARTGHGIAALRAALLAAATEVDEARRASPEEGGPVLHVDRVFTIAGRGTIVTGTLWSGSVSQGDQLRILPADSTARVREVQVHDRAVARAEAHQRVAVNLAGVRRDEVKRGDVLAGAGAADLAPTYRLDVELGVGREEIRDRERVQVHHGTRETPARIVLLADDLAQLRLEAPLIAAAGDRFVLRRIAPPDTLGGGRVLDANARRHGPGPLVQRLRLIQAGEGEPIAAAAPIEEREADSRPRADPGIGPALAPQALDLLRSDGAMPRGPRALAESLGVEVTDALASLDALAAAGEVVRVKPDVYYPYAELERLRGGVVDLIEAQGPVTLPEARDALGLSRKYAQAVLEHLDARRVTIRHGERRVLRRRRPLPTLDAER
jgi:selenocysteine-specific elongation factor